MAGNIGQDTAHPHGKKKERLIVLLHSQPDKKPSNQKHEPHPGVSHSQDTAEQFSCNTFPWGHFFLLSHEPGTEGFIKKGPDIFQCQVLCKDHLIFLPLCHTQEMKYEIISFL